MVYGNFKNNNMNKNQKYLAVIPARGGSTRLPRKNLRMILDKPLIVWTIESAKKSKLLDRIIISTDDEEIKKIALEYDIEIHHRTPELAYIGDDVNDLKLMKTVGLSAAPANAIKDAKKISTYTCITNGGEGAFREFVDLILQNKKHNNKDDFLKR